MTVYLVGAGPGDPGLLTRRGAHLLGRADVVIYDRLVHSSVLALAPDAAALIDVGKRPGAPEGGERQEEINHLLVLHGQQSDTVVRLKGGDPFLFGRGGEEIEALSAAGVAWEVVPGVTSAFGVAAAAGIPATHRGLASSVTVVTGHVGDAGSPDGVDWNALATLDGTLIVLMGMRTRAAIAEALLRGGKAADTPVAVIEKGTTPSQRTVRTTLEHLHAVDLGSPAIIVIGPVAALGATVSPLVQGPLAGRTIVVTRAGSRAKGLTDALHHVGARVIEMPLTTQTGPSDGGAALARAAATVAEHAWVVFTSVNAVHRLMGALRDARVLGTVQVAAVGTATADALRMAGVEPDLIPAEHWAQGLIEVFPEAGDARNTSVLFPAADQAPDTLAQGLGQKGWHVTKVEAYRTVELPAAEPELLAQVAQADAITFTATSSVKAFLALRTPDGAPVPVPPVVLCIGPTTAQNAQALGLEGVDTSWGASTEGMVAALVHRFGEPHDDGS